MSQILLRADRITKRFSGVAALREVTFDLREGEIHAICGENGAGKSTLIKLLSGIHPHGSYEGTLRVRGEEARFKSVADAQAADIAVIYQELALVEEMTVAENIFLGAEPRRGGLINWPALWRNAGQLLQQFGFALPLTAKVSSLGVGQKQLVEIVKALSRNSKILILDEPTAALASHEVEILAGILGQLRQRGISCIYISHRLDEVFALADRITVLRDGAVITTVNTRDTTRTAIIQRMVGREIRELFPERNAKTGAVIFEAQDLTVAEFASTKPRLKGISFSLREGEVLGIGGLMGAGRTELLMHLFGLWGKRLRGTVRLGGREMLKLSARECIEAGLILISEDRRRYGLILEQDLGFNLSLSSIEEFAANGLIDAHGEYRRNREFFSALNVRARDLNVAAKTLSGGNQQKVVLAKGLMTDPRVILLDEPTRGIDVGAKHEIYELINRLTDEGKAVVLVSSELLELMAVSDRILMLCNGGISAEFSRANASPEALLSAAISQRNPSPPL
jgi:D-xylose transport system ATP-binding protein